MREALKHSLGYLLYLTRLRTAWPRAEAAIERPGARVTIKARGVYASPADDDVVAADSQVVAADDEIVEDTVTEAGVAGLGNPQV